jgi:hypothetical protein
MSNRLLTGRAGKRCPYEVRPLVCGNITEIPCHYCIGASHGTYLRDWIYPNHDKRRHSAPVIIELGGRLWDKL